MNNNILFLKKELTSNYGPESITMINKAYDLAEYLHKDQKRESGEPYIIHPLNVAYILSLLHVDSDTICAALLHDTIEDTKMTKEELERLFNYDVANLVDGVSKISKMNFSTKEEQRLANTRKIILGLTNDVRIIIIKLADRLHNMRTLQYKRREKQIENSIETLEIFVPLAYYLGLYEIKKELENLSLFYLYPDDYKRVKEDRENIKCLYQNKLFEMRDNISSELDKKNMEKDINIRIKDIYSIYKEREKKMYTNQKFRVTDIHDLFSIKINVSNIDDCYRTLGIVHSKYLPINSKFKDYICRPKTNKYQAIHTTVYGFDNHLVQTQIKTFTMDRIASTGITEYWNEFGQNAKMLMQQELKKYQFYDSLIEMDKCFGDNLEFVKHIKDELFYDKVYTYNTSNGMVVELPVGSTPIDFAYKVGVGDNMVGAFVNDSYVNPDYILKKGDRVNIIISKNKNQTNLSLDKSPRTTLARTRIQKNNKTARG